MEEITKHLKINATPFKEINKFSDKPGIYALFFLGKSFPIKDYTPAKDEIIYIGKTESSQLSRDANTHFATGKTGSSTLRRTFGSLLFEQYKLTPIPRSQKDIEEKRFAHFKFDLPSEEILTEWMQNNLGLSFYPFTKSIIELDNLETQLIHELVPIINIDRKNPENKYAIFIKKKRKKMSDLAYGINKSLITKPSKHIGNPESINLKSNFSSNSVHKYEDIWKQLIPSILIALESNKPLQVVLNEELFKKVGNRKSYSFNLELEKGFVTNNIDGSAVARDFARVLLNNTAFLKHAKTKHIKIKMGKDFILEML